MESNLWMVPASGVLALLFAFMKSSWINKQDAGNETMKTIANNIREGAMAFLAAEYKKLAIFVVVVAILLAYANYGRSDSNALIALSFVVGAICSGLAGFFGMRVATAANVRTAHAAQKGLPAALDVAFSGGAVMGMSVVGLGVIGLGGLVMLFGTTDVIGGALSGDKITLVLNVVSGFSLGASSIALFARVGGGIFTKAADVGADLVGKVEAGIPEDDPRNPATIADNVGDNVGDVAGMGADLFESYVGAIIGSMVLGITWMNVGDVGNAPVLLPLFIAAAGIVISILATFLVKTKEGGNPQTALDTGTFVAAAVMLVVSWFLINHFLGAGTFKVPSGEEFTASGVFFAVLGGLVAGTLIGIVTEYYTSDHKAPVQSIAKESLTGPATNIISGLGVGMWSTALPTILICAAILTAHHFAGLYGIAMAALGMLCTTGIQLAVDAYGPIADNAGGIAEMAHLDPEVRNRTDKLDAVGNTTAAIGKGFAIGSAALTALALFAAYAQKVGLLEKGINVMDPQVMVGVFIGGMLPFVFSAMAMNAVGRAAGQMIEEVRRQFREIPGLREGAEGAVAEHAKCVKISTDAAIKEMVVPGLMAIIVPILAGFYNVATLGGVLVGTTVGGVMMAIFMSNAGGAWDNAKKFVEAGNHGGKGSDAHKAAVIGDTVGDPFKDTAGPALNILIKLMSVVALVFAPVFAAYHGIG